MHVMCHTNHSTSYKQNPHANIAEFVHNFTLMITTPQIPLKGHNLSQNSNQHSLAYRLRAANKSMQKKLSKNFLLFIQP